MFSGNCFSLTRQIAQSSSDAFARAAECADGTGRWGNSTLSCLRRLTVTEVLAAQRSTALQDPSVPPFALMVDDRLIRSFMLVAC